MANENVSPEERLFNIIKEKQSSPPEKGVQQKRSITGSLQGFFAGLLRKPAPRDQASAAPVASPPPFATWHEVNLKTINGLAMVVLCLLIVLVVYYGVVKRPKLADMVQAISRLPAQAVVQKDERNAVAFQPLAVYLEQVNKRDIFRPSPQIQRDALAVTPKAKESRAKLEELAKDLKLVGIAWGLSPVAMIRSEKDKNTYFVKPEQAIGTTGIKVKQIFKEKVILEYQGEDMDLL